MKHKGTLNKTGITRMIVIPDLQIPYHDSKVLKVVEKYMASKKFDYYLNIGDFMDFDEISSFNENFLRKLENRRLLKDYTIGNRILDRHQKIIRKNNPKAKFVYLAGNHENRIDRYLDKIPAMEGLIEVPTCLKLEERGFLWIESWINKREMFTLGKANFIHGDKTTANHAKSMVGIYGDNIFYGHTHDVCCYSTQRMGDDKTLVGQSLGCLCRYDLDYLKGRPTNWQQAFAVFEFSPDGFFNYQIYRIFKGRFIAEGKVWK